MRPRHHASAACEQLLARTVVIRAGYFRSIPPHVPQLIQLQGQFTIDRLAGSRGANSTSMPESAVFCSSTLTALSARSRSCSRWRAWSRSCRASMPAMALPLPQSRANLQLRDGRVTSWERAITRSCSLRWAKLGFLGRDDIGHADHNGTHVPVAGNGGGSHQVRPPKSTVTQRARRPVQACRSTAACHSWRPERISARSARVSMRSSNRTLCTCGTAISGC